MASIQIGETDPYVAANGHLMVAPIYRSDAGREYQISAYARCADECRACRAGGSPNDYCNEKW